MAEKSQEKILKSVENLIDSDRVLNFSDGVFAFAATLLVLKIDLPSLSPLEINSGRLLSELINLWPQYFANIISFLIIGYYWLSHHAIFSLIKRFNPVIIWLNILFLVFVSFIPFPVDLFGDYSNSLVVIMFYSLSLSAVGFLLASIWLYAVNKRGLIQEGIGKHQIFYYSCRFLLAPVVFLLSAPLAFIDPAVAKISWLFVIAGIIIINKSFHFKNLSVIEKESV